MLSVTGMFGLNTKNTNGNDNKKTFDPTFTTGERRREEVVKILVKCLKRDFHQKFYREVTIDPENEQ